MKIDSRIKVFGDMSYRNKKCPTETTEQITFFNVLKTRHPRLAKVAVHIRNEGNRTVQQAMRHKAEGMNTGASDIFIPGAPSLLIELKRKDHTLCKLSEDQSNYLIAASEIGAFTCVALGYEAALEAVEVWLNVAR